MPTPAQIDEQIKLERLAISHGVNQLRDQEDKAEKREYASSTVYGRSSIAAAQDLVQQGIMNTFKEIKARKNGYFHAEIVMHLHKMNNEDDAHVLASIGMKRLWDTVFSKKDPKKSKKPPYTTANVITNIGNAVEAECQIRWYIEQNPGLMDTIKKKYWLSTTGSKQKQSVAQIMMNRNDYYWDKWSEAATKAIGAWLLRIIANETGWFQRVQVGKGRTKYEVIRPTDAYTAIQEQLQNEAELFAPNAYPMLIEPNPWTNERHGGYLLNEVMRGHQMVRSGNPFIIQPEEPLNFLNKLQRVEYRLNDFTYQVAKELHERGVKVGKFKPRSYAANWVMPNKPYDIETNEDARQSYRRESTDAMNAKMKYLRSESCRTEKTMELAKLFEGRTFYLPWSFDYRGRVYPIPPFLSVQDTDFGKSLLRFATESFMTPEAEEWLAFQVATTYGLDKKPISERIEWVNHHHELIARIATDPIGCLPEWEAADEPWQFLSACEEYYHCVIACDRQFTGLMIATDATCSGMQILAGLAQDKRTAELVNVTPGDKPADAYMAVQRQMIDKVPSHLQQYFDRSCVKRSVMTIPYNATLQSSKEYIHKALRDNLPKEIELSFKESFELAKVLRQAMDVVAPGPLKVMDWIGKSMSAAIKNGNDAIQWTTPSGFIVYQKRDKWKTRQLDMQIMGRCQVRIRDENLGPDSRRHKSSGAPNLIHSLDASLLCLTFNKFEAPFSVIHDSILCRATDMGSLSNLIRESYCEVFSGESFLLDFAQQIGAETPPPIIGDLRPENVLVSTYFFC